ncbi:MAG: hypothetical protein IH963_05870 [Chloroflexi bacterium]|nr:hypothetical protein [Chloroflexota bacterium]
MSAEVPPATEVLQPTVTPGPVMAERAGETPEPHRPAAVAATPVPTPLPAPTPTSVPEPTPKPTVQNIPSHSVSAGSSVIWWFNGTAWAPKGTPPTCSDPFVLQTPVDMNKVTAALWPGQSRGGYKGHGGFSFDASSADSVIVRAPVGSHLVQAARYLQGDEEQILLFFSVPCGFFYRFDHVRGLSPKIEDALKIITGPASADSRTTLINPPLWVEQGEVVGTSVGIPQVNIFVDFGLYDVRQPNNVTPDPAWADSFANDKEFGHYGVCFFDYLPGTDGQTLRSLPTGVEGKTSDYC